VDQGEIRSEVVVVGAGPAGIAAALALKDVGLRPLVVEQAEEIASSWRRRYDRLRLNTSRVTSRLPRRPFPKGTPMFPSRDQVVEYLDRNAREQGIDLRLGTKVERIDRGGDGWAVRTSRAEIAAPQVIVATGYEQEPIIPDWPGRASFAGELLHSSEYRNAERYAGGRVLVVGPGCSGMEIAYDLAEGGADKVWLAVRTPPNIILREGPGGVPGDFFGIAMMRLPASVGDRMARFGRRMDLGDLTEYGLPIPEEGVFSRLRRLGVAPAIVDREVIEAVKDGRIEVVRAVEALDGREVRLADGAVLDPSVVICATGFRRRLEPLVGHLDVLDAGGMPRVVGGDAAAPGLRFLGFVPRPGQLGYMGREARKAARGIKRELQPSKAA
jgi:cation diffusion facilitator CzcD-associated flavoprotein CzcO